MSNDYGKSTRMDILEREIVGRLFETLKKHNWLCEIVERQSEGEYIFFTILKNTKKLTLAAIYSQHTQKAVFEKIFKCSPICFIRGEVDEDCFFTKGMSLKIYSFSDIMELVKDWNAEAEDDKIETLEKSANAELLETKKGLREVIHITAENPQNKIWDMIRALKSERICINVLKQKMLLENCKLGDEIIVEKAKGLRYLTQNAIDYFEASTNNLTQRLLNLYYGTVSFVESEIISNVGNNHTMHKLEESTKYGHGLWTLNPENGNVGDMEIGILRNGLFSSWMESRDIDLSFACEKRPKSKEEVEKLLRMQHHSFNSLLLRLPELDDLFQLMNSDNTPLYVISHGLIELNNTGGLYSKQNYTANNKGTYVGLTDRSGKMTLTDLKGLRKPVKQLESYSNIYSDVTHKAFVSHDTGHWHDHVNIHISPFGSETLILPMFNEIDEWEVVAFVVLYALSIIVRYLPTVWWEVQYGELNEYLVLVERLSEACERLFPQIFLQKIMGKKIYTHLKW